MKLSVKENSTVLDKIIKSRENYQGLQELQDVSLASHSKSKYQAIVFFLFYFEIEFGWMDCDFKFSTVRNNTSTSYRIQEKRLLLVMKVAINARNVIIRVILRVIWKVS